MVLPGVSRGIKKKQKTGSYQSRFVLRVQGLRGGNRRCFRFPVLTPGGRVKGLGGRVDLARTVLPRVSTGIEKEQKTGSYQSRFVLRVEGLRGGDGRCFRFPVLIAGGRVKGLGGKVLPGSIPLSFPSRTTEPPSRTRPLGGGDRGGGGG